MRILRESQDFSQEYVAFKLDMHQRTYSNLESGKTKLTIDRIQKLAELYQVEPEYFLSEELPVINYNTGPNSHGGVFETYNNDSGKLEFMRELYEKLLRDKNERILQLEDQIKTLTSLLEKISK